jgi:hypothetical protein
MATRRETNGCATRGRAFTLIEAVICLGVIMLLVGLVVPALAKARESARMTRDLAVMRTCVTLLHSYCTESKGLFPLVGNDMLAISNWWRAVGPQPGVADASLIDPVGVREFGAVRAIMSACFVVRPEDMEPGNTVHIDLVQVRAMTDASVVSPASKGTLYMQSRMVSGRHTYWAITPAEYASQGPIAFLDGSATVGRWPDFVVEPPYFEHWVGWPVLATWHGVRGRDVRR